MQSPLVSVAELQRRLGEQCPTLLDVRWGLAGGADRPEYVRGHIPGAAFVDLDRDLAGPPGAGGRHPLPTGEAFAASMRAAGVSGLRPVVVYDAATSMAAARAWWLLRYFGHRAVAVLDGGLAAWLAAGGPVVSGPELPVAGDFDGRPGAMPVLDAAAAAALARSGVLLDAREAGRFRGDHEPVDPVGGHIPGARNRPTTLNLEHSGRFRDPSALRAGFAQIGCRGEAEARIGAYCGSGITAAHEVLAVELAGFRAALYPGSWSEWITDRRRPVAIGPS
jgi:thiosulfate/3-mercaptopyruvate sulfurtransferase